VLATILVTGNMVGSSIYLLPATMGAIGSISLLGWLAATVGVAVLGGVFSWLAILRPEAGGLMADIGEGLGPGAGFVGAFVYWAQCWVGNVAIALAVTGYVSVFVPVVAKGPAATACTIAILWLLVAANAFGPRFVARLQGGTLLLGLAPIALVAIGGWAFFHPAIFIGSWNVTGAPAASVLPHAVVLALWGFLGVESAIVVAALVREPRRNVPIATLGGVALSALIYISACGVIMGMIPAVALARSTAPFADAARIMLGASIGAVVAVLAILKTSGALGGWVLVTAETGGALFRGLAPLRARKPRDGRASTIASLLLTGALMTVAALVSASPTIGGQFATMVDVSVVLTLIVYVLGCLALVRLSAAAKPATRLFLRALGLGGAAFCLVVIASSEPGLLAWSLGVLGAGVAVYLALGRRRSAGPAISADD
jgi:arginine:agmatine antiporter